MCPKRAWKLSHSGDNREHNWGPHPRPDTTRPPPLAARDSARPGPGVTGSQAVVMPQLAQEHPVLSCAFPLSLWLQLSAFPCSSQNHTYLHLHKTCSTRPVLSGVYNKV